MTASPGILLVGPRPRSVVRQSARVGGVAVTWCAPSDARGHLTAPGRVWLGVVWAVQGAARQRTTARACCALRRDLPFIALAGARASGKPPAGFRRALPPGTPLDLIVSALRQEAEMMALESRLAISRGQARSLARRLSVLSDISQAANSVLEPRKVMEIVMSRAQVLISAEAWSLLLVDDKEHTMSLELVQGEKVTGVRSHRLRVGQGVAGWVVQYRKPLIINDVSQDRRFDSRFDTLAGHTRSILCAPLISRGRIIGAVELINKRRGQFTPQDLDMVMVLVEPGAIAIENAILYQKSAELTVTDDLTKLFNSRYLNVHLGREIKRSRRYGVPVSLIFLDLDGFKEVNDRHGHLAGSRALYEVGQVIQETVREIDIVSRYGGDEFTIILPQTGAAGAGIIAERIRASIEERAFLAEQGLSVRLTASFGVATFPDTGQTREDLIQRADQAMYQVKDRGKNGVALAPVDALKQKGHV